MMVMDIAEYLQSNGVGTIGDTIFVSQYPPIQTAHLVLYEYQGEQANQFAETESPGLQIMARANTYGAAHELIGAANRVLRAVGFEMGEPDGITVNGTRYYRIAPTLSGEINLGFNDAGLMELTKNYYVLMDEQ